jgi:hypothetical protein
MSKIMKQITLILYCLAFLISSLAQPKIQKTESRKQKMLQIKVHY